MTVRDVSPGIFLGIVGPPNAGKGSTVEAIASDIARLTGKRPPIISASGLLRSPDDKLRSIGVSNEDIDSVRRLMRAGKLVPARVIQRCFDARLRETDCQNGCIIEGFPRLASDPRFLEHARPLSHFVVLRTDEAVIRARAAERWTCPDTGDTFSRTTHPDAFVNGTPLHPVSRKQLIRRADDADPKSLNRRIDAFNGTTLVTARKFLKAKAPQRRGMQVIEVDTSDLMPGEVVRRIREAFDWSITA